MSMKLYLNLLGRIQFQIEIACFPRLLLDETNFVTLDSPCSSNSESSDDNDKDLGGMTYYQWMNVDRKVPKVPVKIEIMESETLLEEKIKVLKNHI